MSRFKAAVRVATDITPWILGIATLFVYLFTLNRWVTLTSLPIVAKVTGWDWWTPNLQAPLHFLLTYPVHWLPPGWQAPALNFFSAVCAALTLALLARSVALLPHDRTREQRHRERSEHSLLSLPSNWVPPAFAVLLCGLQLTFWEHATAATGEMLNLLLFAYVVRCLLEYRIGERNWWLYRAAFVFALAATNDWAMWGFAPVFLVAVVWIKGRGFFNGPFLGGMAGAGALGLLLYVVLPFVGSRQEFAGGTFWQLLSQELQTQKNTLLQIPRWVPLLLSLTAFLPLITLGIRWPSSLGETNPAAATISNLMFRVVHLVFLGICAWVAFDPPFSPRVLGLGLPFLSFYFLGALCAGYYFGYFLLIFSEFTGKGWQRPSRLVRSVHRMLRVALYAGFVAVPAALAWQNAPHLLANNSSALRQYAELMVKAVPENAIIASDDPLSLLLVSAHANGLQSQVSIDTRYLSRVSYYRSLAKRHPGIIFDPFTQSAPPEPLRAEIQANFMKYLTLSNEVYYLHPSFGHQWFELLYQQPRGLVYKLKAYPLDAITEPALTDELLAENQAFWAGTGGAFEAVTELAQHKRSDPFYVARYYSRTINCWGAQLQRAGLRDEAKAAFTQALQLNEDNVAARVNRDQKADFDVLGRYRTWSSLLAYNGSFDEATVCAQLGRVFTQFNLLRHAAAQFTRARDLAPANTDYHLKLADVYLRGNLPDQVLAVVNDLRANHAGATTNRIHRLELARLEAMANFQKGDTNNAEKLLLAAHKQDPDEIAPLEALTQLFLVTGRLEEAMATLGKQLQLDPQHVGALVNKAALLMHAKDYQAALGALDTALNVDPYNVLALQNRAITCLNLGRFEVAKRDLETLRGISPNLPAIYFNLGEIAYHTKKAREAMLNYEKFLKFVPSGSPDAIKAAQRLKELRGG
ncbi:MAG: tetratricopeptide repeat protein [Verrucomicrobiota bacterium]